MVFKQDNPGFYASIDSGNNIFHRRVCLIAEGTAVPGHPCVGVNRVRDFDGFFHIAEIFDYIETIAMKPQNVSFSEIWHQVHYQGEREREVSSGQRYRDADTSFPGVLAPIKNPDNKPYRMLDGRHRMWKQQEAGQQEGLFYVIPEPDIDAFFWMVMPLASHRQQLDRM